LLPACARAAVAAGGGPDRREGGELLDELVKSGSGERSRLGEHDGLTLDGDQRRDRGDRERRSELALHLGVDLAEGDAGVLLRGLFGDGAEEAARAAP
jgi:hypothetical protein